MSGGYLYICKYTCSLLMFHYLHQLQQHPFRYLAPISVLSQGWVLPRNRRFERFCRCSEVACCANAWDACTASWNLQPAKSLLWDFRQILFPKRIRGPKKMGPFGLVRPFRGVEVSYFPLYWLVNGDSMVYYNPYISG